MSVDDVAGNIYQVLPSSPRSVGAAKASRAAVSQGLTLGPVPAQLELTLPLSAQLKLTLSPK